MKITFFITALISVFLVGCSNSLVNPKNIDDEYCKQLTASLIEKIKLKEKADMLNDKYVQTEYKNIEVFYSPIFKQCLFSLNRENYALTEDGKKRFNNETAEIYVYDTNDQIYWTITEAFYNGRNENGISEYKSELEKYKTDDYRDLFEKGLY